MNPSAIRCLIVDDEPQAHEVLKAHIAVLPALVHSGSCYNAVEAISLLQHQAIDLVFLDIRMPRLTGLELIRTLVNAPKVILVTAHPEFAIDGYELGVVDYLLKPVSFERFVKAIQKITIQNSRMEPVEPESSDKFLYFRVDRKMVKVRLCDLLYAESLKDYVKLVTRQGTLITKLPLSNLVEMLPEHEFIQVHRSFVVARRQVDAYAADSLQIGKVNLPVGPLYRHTLKAKMLEFRWP